MTDWNPNDPDAVRVYYDLSAWSLDHQAELAEAMAEAEIAHSWDGAELMVPEDAEHAADALIVEVEQRLGISSEADSADVRGAEPAEAVVLADDVPITSYDLDEWPSEDRVALTNALIAADIAHRWDVTELFVGTDSEEIVDTLLDEIESGEYVDFSATPTQGEQLPFEVLTTFFLAGERLRRDTLDAHGLEQLLAATDVADADSPPFGVQPRLWRQTCELAERLADALAGDDLPDHDEAAATAAALHELLRPVV